MRLPFIRLFGESPPALAPRFVLRPAELESLSGDRPYRRLSVVYNESPRFSDGVLELHNGTAWPHNLMPWHNNAAELVASRNWRLIQEIIKRDSPQTREVLTSRVQNADLSFDLRLIYAGILAAVNDDAGRDFLLDHAENDRHENLKSIFWVIGNLYRLRPIEPQQPARDDPPKPSRPDEFPQAHLDLMYFATGHGAPDPRRPLGSVDMSWAENVMIDAINSHERTYRDCAIIYGSFPELLVKMKSERGIEQACSRLLEIERERVTGNVRDRS